MWRYDIENGNYFPTEKVLISLVKNLNFKDKTEIYNLYAEIKESAPPDIIDFLVIKMLLMRLEK